MLLHMREEASSFEKNRSCLCHTFTLSQYLLLFSIFLFRELFCQISFYSTNLFQGLPQVLQLNGSYLGSSLGFSVIGTALDFLGPQYTSLSLKIYFLKFDIFSWGYPRCSSENVPSILEKLYHLFEWFQSQLFALLFLKSCV